MTSRVAKNPVKLPSGVAVSILSEQITVKGKLGELKQNFPSSIELKEAEGLVHVKSLEDSSAMAGTMRSLVQNMVTGVSDGFTKKLVLVGVGYRAKVMGTDLDLTVGLSHPMVMKMPQGISVECPSNTEILVKGIDKQLVGQVAANIRAVRPPEPYKGKGIRYENEQISLKEGKKK